MAGSSGLTTGPGPEPLLLTWGSSSCCWISWRSGRRPRTAWSVGTAGAAGGTGGAAAVPWRGTAPAGGLGNPAGGFGAGSFGVDAPAPSMGGGSGMAMVRSPTAEAGGTGSGLAGVREGKGEGGDTGRPGFVGTRTGPDAGAAMGPLCPPARLALGMGGGSGGVIVRVGAGLAALTGGTGGAVPPAATRARSARRCEARWWNRRTPGRWARIRWTPHFRGVWALGSS